jgi:hypothetical protein
MDNTIKSGASDNSEQQLLFQNTEKGKQAIDLMIANKELVFQNQEKEKRAAELAIANKEHVLAPYSLHRIFILVL